MKKWNNINISEIIKLIETNIDSYNNTINNIINQKNLELTWDNIVQPLEDAKAKLDEQVNIIVHLHSVKDNEELREAYSYILPKLSDLEAGLLQNVALYKNILNLKQSIAFNKLIPAQQKIITDLLLDFKLAGIDLSPAEQQQYKTITKQLGELSDQFAKNLLDATNQWRYFIDVQNKEELHGVPEHLLNSIIINDTKQGFELTLDFPVVDGVLRYATNRELREVIYKANITKASEFTPEFDNSKVMDSIISLRKQLALLLGFNNYSEYSLAHKMANTTKEVLDFLDQIKLATQDMAKHEFAKLEQFANIKLQPWDVAFYAQQYKKHLFDLSDEELRNYFPIKLVLPGIFNLANKLFNIIIIEVDNPDVWDPLVKLYKIIDSNNNLLGFFYTDLYVRKNKKSGAWMAECLSRHKYHNKNLQYPIAFLVTNFAKGEYLYHEEVLTLLHEFGHTLHHVLTKVDYISNSGCNGVSWDAVELPSQFMEKWGYTWDFLQEISEHAQFKNKLPEVIFNNLIKLKNYNTGMFIIRQLEFAMFDFRLHMDNANNTNIQGILNQVRQEVTVVPVSDCNRFQHSFCHIFAGGYAAGYYSYSWAEILAADAFMAFNNKEDINFMGLKFLANILELGGSKEAMELYILFRGCKPDINSWLQYKCLLD